MREASIAGWLAGVKLTPHWSGEFAELWSATYAPLGDQYAWDANPWVWFCKL